MDKKKLSIIICISIFTIILIILLLLLFNKSTKNEIELTTASTTTVSTGILNENNPGGGDHGGGATTTIVTTTTGVLNENNPGGGDHGGGAPKTSTTTTFKVSTTSTSTTTKSKSYTCPDGYELNNDKCTITVNAIYDCPPNTTSFDNGSSNGCVNLSEGYERPESGCPNGTGEIHVLAFMGTPEKYECLPLHNKTYQCEDGYKLNNNKCTKTINATLK